MKYNFIRPNQFGFSLIEMIIAVALLGIISLGIAGSFTSYLKDMGQMRLASSRADIVRQIRTAALNTEALRNSQTLEPSLTPCLLFTSGGPQCVSKSSSGSLRKTPFTLISALDVTDIIAGAAVATGPHQPVYFDKDGRRCTNPAARPVDCPLQAIVEFSSHCAGGTPTCQSAEAITVDYVVQLRDDLPGQDQPLRPALGSITTNLRQGRYVRVPSAVAVGTGLAVNEVDMAQGQMLAVGPLEEIRMQVLLRDSDPIDSLEVRAWHLPDGCDFSMIDTGSCIRPAVTDYVLKTQVNTGFSAAAAGQVSVSFTAGNTGYTEVLVLSKAGGVYKQRANTLLRLKAPGVPIATVTGPQPLRKDCTDPTPARFTFQAEDPIGLAAYTVSVTPPLPDGSTTLPGFSFSLGNTAPQDFALPYNVFQAGVTYVISFTVRNNDGIEMNARHTMHVSPPPDPPQSVVFQTPSASTFLRSSDSLVVDALAHVPCGQTLTSFNVSTAKSGGAQWMPPKALTCNPADGPSDLVTYSCSAVLTCQEWLNLADCSTFAEPYGVGATLSGTATPSSGTDFSGDISFKVGNRISVAFEESDTRQFIVRDRYNRTTLSLRTRFAAAPPSSVSLRLRYPDGSYYPFSCPANASTCTITSAPIPTTSGAIVLMTDAASAADYMIVMPDLVQVDFVEDYNSCASQMYPVTCSGGKTLQMEVTRFLLHDGQFSLSKVQDTVQLYSGGNLDFLVIHRRKPSGPANQLVALGLTLRHYDASTSLLATTTTVPLRQPTSVPASLLRVSDEYWRFHSGQQYSSNSKVQVVVESAAIESVFVRQCYCQ